MRQETSIIELVNRGVDTRTIQGYLGHRDIMTPFSGGDILQLRRSIIVRRKKVMAPVKQCPKCKLITPDNVERCDCGYDFESGQVKESYVPPAQPPEIKPHKTATGVAGFMSALALGKTYLDEGFPSIPIPVHVHFQAVATAAMAGAIAYALVFGFQYIRFVITRRKARR